jgi:hypothetical protein
MSALPRKRTWFSTAAMSTLCHKRTLARLFDHFVGGCEQGLWESQAQRLCRFQIQH